MAIGPDALRVTRELRSIIAGHVDDETRRLVQAWARAWDQIIAEVEAAAADIAALDTAPTFQQVLRMDRARRALDAADRRIQSMMADLADRAATTANQVAAATSTHDSTVIAAQLPRERGVTLAQASARFDLVNEEALAAIVERTTTQITSLTQPLADDAIASMIRALTKAIPQGLSPRDAAARMVRGTERSFNGGLTRALTIARTEVLDAYRTAARVHQDANADVLQGWVWLASLDSRTCPSCIAQAGSIHPLTEGGPEDHQNGRCARMPYVKPWAELGIGRDEPASQLQDGAAWFAGQPESVQLQIMGPARLELIKSGRASVADMSMRIETPGWRPSYIATPVGKLAA